MTTIRHLFILVPDRFPLTFSALGGESSNLISGSFMFSGVTMASPVETLGSTGCFSRCFTSVLTPSSPILNGF